MGARNTAERKAHHRQNTPHDRKELTVAKTAAPPQHERPTLGAQLARQHELLMATLTKPARTGSQTVEYGERATGADSGSLYVKSLVLVQRDDESDVQFLGRQEAQLRNVAQLLERLNADSEQDAEDGEGEAA
jgi:hypothetical protein